MIHSAPHSQRTTQHSVNVGVVVTPGFSFLSLGSLLAPLQYVEDTLPGCSLKVSVFSEREPVASEPSDVTVSCAHSLEELSNSLDSLRGLDAVFFCCGHDVPMPSRDPLRRLLRKCHRTGVRIYGIGSANWIMAETQTVPKGQVAIHWSSLDAFAERNAELEAKSELFISDGKFTSCAGELATLDLTIDFLRQEFGERIANAVCNHFLVSFARSSNAAQPGASSNRLRHAPLIIQSMVKMLRGNLSDDVSLDEVASAHCISKRQMERIFKKHLNTTPGRFLRKLRVEMAYQLIEQTEMPVLDIVFSCGFHSPAVFSRHFREEYGMTPRDLREAKAQAAKYS